MTMMTLQPKGFFSYTRQDDEAQGKILSKLRELIQSELQLQYGRGKIDIFQDTRVIKPGADFPIKTKAAMNEVVFFIPILTPNFVQSEWCCREVRMFLEREQEIFKNHPELPREQRLLWPIHLIDVSKTKSFDPDVIGALSDIQFTDFRSLRFDIKAETREVHTQIERLAIAIRDILNTEITMPPTTEELIARKNEDQRIARLARSEAAREAKAAKLLADQQARDDLAAEQKKKADQLIEEQMKAGELAAAKVKTEAARLAKANHEVEKRKKEERRRQFWIATGGWAKRYWMVPAVVAAVAAVAPLIGNLANEDSGAVANQANASTMAAETSEAKPPPPLEAPDWLVRRWARNGKCDAMIISRLPDGVISVSTNGNIAVSKEVLVALPTQDTVETSDAVYSLKNGTILTKKPRDLKERVYSQC